MIDELYYDEAAIEWIVRLWSDTGHHDERPADIDEAVEATLDKSCSYQCDSEPGPDGYQRVLKIGEVISESERQ